MSTNFQSRACGPEDRDRIARVINQAAQRYKGAIPDDCWHEPYMSLEALDRELDAGVRFIGIEADEGLVAVMGLQAVQDVRLIRHAYVNPAWQAHGLGGLLMKSLTAQRKQDILVGAWAAATWAIAFYEKHGFRLQDAAEASALLRRYWTVSPRQIETSVVLRLPA